MTQRLREIPPSTRARIESLAEAALEIPEAERAAFLAARCGEDQELRREVTSFLDALEASAGYLERERWLAWRDPPGEEGEGANGGPSPGDQLGAYRIERMLGRGGMGTVYLARRDDDAFDKLVALKLVTPGSGDHLVRRFRQERDILARLEHPYIARLYDAGNTADGQPYFVMEYVAGRPVDEHCDAHRLGISERLEILLRVCEAVQLAHRNLVVHRDLKPANILVDDGGDPKLLDFGVAKLLGDSPGGAEDPAPATQIQPLTPLFASPEQVEGRAVTTATDVYALGLIAYRLLTATVPFAEHRGHSARMARAIAEEDARNPSAVVAGAPEGAEEILPGLGNRVLARKLAGDLDAILLKALRKEPAQRYPSVEALAEDLRRYLGGFPVEARRGNFLYQAGKFLRRQRTLAAAAAAVFLLTLGFVAATAEQARRTARQRDRALAVESFLIDTFAQADPLQDDGTVSARQMLDRGAARVSRELREQPEVRATLLRAMGESYLGLGVLDRARELLLEALAAAPAPGEEPGEERARTLVALARTELAQSRLQGAEDLALQALSEDSGRRGLSDRLEAEALRVLAHVAREKADWKRAEGLLQRALAHYEAGSSTDHPDYATTLRELGRVYMERTTFGKAEEALERVLEIQTRRYGPESLEVGVVLVAQAELALYQAGSQRGERLITRAMGILEPALGRGHPLMREARGYRAGAIGALGRTAEAEAILRSLLEEELPLLGPDHPQIANRRYNLGVHLADLQRNEEAEIEFRRSLEIVEAAYPEGHRRVAIMRSSYGNLLTKLGRYEEARPLHLRSLEDFRGLPPVEATGAAFPIVGLGVLDLNSGNLEGAAARFREALKLWQSHPDRPKGRIVFVSGFLAGALLRQGRHAEAESVLLGMEPLVLELYPPGHPTRRGIRRGFKKIYEELERPEAARAQADLLEMEEAAWEESAADRAAAAEAP